MGMDTRPGPTQGMTALALPLTVVLFLASHAYLSWAATFDFYLLDTMASRGNGEIMCKDLGYDGLAALSSPDAHRYAMELTEPNKLHSGKDLTEITNIAQDRKRWRELQSQIEKAAEVSQTENWDATRQYVKKTTLGPNQLMHIGLNLQKSTRTLYWTDGASPASDIPWRKTPQELTTNRPRGLVYLDGTYGMARETKAARLTLCGKHDLRESYGTTLSGQQPHNVTSYLSLKETPTYLKCATLCATDPLCRVAEFHLGLHTCATVGPGNFSGFTPNAETKTFLRSGYL